MAKMTDNEIIKALGCCKNSICTYCPRLGIDVQKNLLCHEELMYEVLDLINRQQAEIKRLTSGKCVYLSDDETTEYCVEGPCPKYKTEEQIKAEAVKEFAERLKTEVDIDLCEAIECSDYLHDDLPKIIDNLVKEMAGEG